MRQVAISRVVPYSRSSPTHPLSHFSLQENIYVYILSDFISQDN